MPNPATLHHRSIKIDHHLKIVDFFIHVGCPKTFHVEPNYKSYKPDVYMHNQKGIPVCVEVQLTPISHKKMENKTIEFMTSHKKKEHDAVVLLLVSDKDYGIQLPKPYSLITIPVPKEPYSETQKRPS